MSQASRDPQLTFNKRSLLELQQQSSDGFDWLSYFTSLSKPPESLGEVNVSSLEAITSFPALLTDASAVRHYLAFHVLKSFSPHLSSRFVSIDFDFFENELKGTQQLPPRWKSGLRELEVSLGEALGQLYVQKHFSVSAKEKALQIVEAVRNALRVRLQEVDWMGEDTKREAFAKMDKFRVKIGWVYLLRIHILVSPCISVSISVFVCLSVLITVSIISVSVLVSLPVSVCLSVRVSISLYICSIYVSICDFIETGAVKDIYIHIEIQIWI